MLYYITKIETKITGIGKTQTKTKVKRASGRPNFKVSSQVFLKIGNQSRWVTDQDSGVISCLQRRSATKFTLSSLAHHRKDFNKKLQNCKYRCVFHHNIHDH
jgi:hypothetical protein